MCTRTEQIDNPAHGGAWNPPCYQFEPIETDRTKTDVYNIVMTFSYLGLIKTFPLIRKYSSVQLIIKIDLPLHAPRTNVGDLFRL